MAHFYSPRSNDKEVDLEIEMSDENSAESVEEKRKAKKNKTKKESQDYNDQPKSDVCPYPWIHFEHTDKTSQARPFFFPVQIFKCENHKAGKVTKHGIFDRTQNI